METPQAPVRLICVAYVVLVALGLALGEPGGLVSYVVLGAIAAIANGRSWNRHREFRPYLTLTLAVSAFVVAQVSRFFELPTEGASYFAAYGLTALAIVSIIRLRTKSINLESTLEAGMLAAGSLLLLTQGWVLTGAESAVTPLTFMAPVLVFLLGSGFLGQDATGPAMRWWFAAVIAALVSEIPWAIGEDVLFVTEARAHLGSLAFLPLTIAALYPPPASVAIASHRRRHVGPLQILTILGLLILPIVILFQLAQSSSERATVVVVLVGAIAVTITVVGRMWLLIRRRDWSNHCDQVLAQLGERLVLVDDETEAAQAVTDAATKMSSKGRMVCQIVPIADGSLPTATSTIGIRPDLRLNVGAASDERHALINEAVGTGSRAPASVLSSAAGAHELLVGVNSQEASDLSPYVRTLATQYALVLESLEAREETHRVRANNRMRAFVQDSSDIIFLVDAETERVVFASPSLAQVLGTSDADVIGAHPLSILAPEDRTFVEEAVERNETNVDGHNGAPSEVVELDVRAPHVEGHQHWLSLSIRDCSDDPDVGGLVYNFADINERKLAELQLGSSELRYRTMVMNAKDVFVVVDDESAITFISPNIERLLGFDSSDLIGTDFRGLFSEAGRANYESYLEKFERGVGSEIADIEVRTSSGDTMIAELELARPEELAGSLMVSMRDVTENRKLAEDMRDRVENDELTGLLNRRGLSDQLRATIESMRGDEYLATVTLDINDFSKINENLGYLGGDELLVAVSTRLRSQMRSGDALSRQSGDEFTLLSVHQTKEHGDSFGERIAAIFEEPFVIGGRKIRVKASIGSIVTDDVQSTSKRVLEASKMALNFAKGERQKSHVVFENWMREEAAVHFDIALDLADAMRSDEIHLAFQPVISMSSNRVRTVEALLRWQHPGHGNVSPGVFVPIAERSGEIVELGRWALDNACRQTKTWNDSIPGGENLGVSVNLSLLQLEDLSEAGVLQDIVRDSGIDPTHLMIELTESVMIADPNLLRRQLDGFRRMGCKIAVDDFGSGVAGMSHLHDAGHIDVLKIDRRYIEGVDRRDDARTIVSGVIDLAHRMGAKAIAEGIETPPQADALRRLNCDYGQGFYLGRPMVAKRIEKWFSQGWQGEAPALIDRTANW